MANEIINGGGTISDSQYPGGSIHINTTTTLNDGVDRQGDIDPPVDQLTGDQITYQHKIDIGFTPGTPDKEINVALIIDRSGSTSSSSGSDVDGIPGNETFLQAQKFAAQKLFDSYYSLYGPGTNGAAQTVRISLASYGTDGTAHGTYTMDEAGRTQFMADLAGITSGGQTNFAAGLNALKGEWDSVAGITGDDDNRIVFLSDGEANRPSWSFGLPLDEKTRINQSIDNAKAGLSGYNPAINAIGIGANSNIGQPGNPNDSFLDRVDNTNGAVKITDLTQLANLVAQPPSIPGIDLDKVEVEYTYEGVDGQMHTVTKVFPKADIPVVAGSYVLTPSAADLEPNVKGGTEVTMKFTTYVKYTPSGGGPTQTKTYVSTGKVNVLQDVVCFAGSTLIMTDRGEIRASALRPGDMVLTRDHGFQPIRWVGQTRVPARLLGPASRITPIRIKAGALGPHTPQRDLLVSPQHRLVIASEIAQRMFGAAEVLVAAKHLVGYPGVEVAEDLDSVDYVHFAFDRHQLVFADGALSESLYAGPMALAMLNPDQREELLTLFPEWADPLLQVTAARPIPKGAQARTLVARHNANQKALVSLSLH